MRARETRDIHNHLEYTTIHITHTRTIQLLLFQIDCLPARLLIAEARHTCNVMLYSLSHHRMAIIGIKRLSQSATSTF